LLRPNLSLRKRVRLLKLRRPSQSTMLRVVVERSQHLPRERLHRVVLRRLDSSRSRSNDALVPRYIFWVNLNTGEVFVCHIYCLE
jgi:hypothetical protein